MLKSRMFVACIFLVTLPATCADVNLCLSGSSTTLRDIVYNFNIAPEHSKHQFDLASIEPEDVTPFQAV